MNLSKKNDSRFWAKWRAAGAVGSMPFVPPPRTSSRVNYASSMVPVNYKCDGCGATGCKLWREYQTVHTDLLCCDCAAKNQKKDISTMGADGRYTSDYGKTDQIGWFVPAVPDEEGMGYWGYTSVPEAGCKWWYRLPNRPSAAPTAKAS